MTSHAPQEHWPDLSGLGRVEAGATDSRAALLIANAELFVAAPARDRDIIETFETLALGFLSRADDATLATIARILAPCEDTPASILDRLLRHSPDVRDIVLAHMAHVSSSLLTRLLGTPEGRVRLARHSALTPIMVDQLLVMHESAVEDALAANRCIAPRGPAMGELIRRARLRPSLAAHLLMRDSLSPLDEAALYLAADEARRVRIRERLATFAPGDPAAPCTGLTASETAAFLAAAQAGDVAHFEALLSYAFGYPAQTEWRLLAPGRHALLPLALKALDFAERDAIAIILRLHPALSGSLSAVTSLVRTMRSASPALAAVLVRAILGLETPEG